MTDTEFESLKQAIEQKTLELEALQDTYKDETGVRFVMPLRLDFVTQYDAGIGGN